MDSQIEDIIGTEAFEKLGHWTGGMDLSVPENTLTHKSAEIARVIGDDAMVALVRWAGGGRVYIPNLHQKRLKDRRDDIMELREDGKTVDEIAREYRYVGRYTSRQIWALLAMTDERIEEEGKNGDLFA